MSRPIFKKGDKIRRIREKFNDCVVGEIYTVVSSNSLGVTLEEVAGGYDSYYFELVPKHQVTLNEDLFTM